MAGHIGQLLSPRHQQAELGITAFLGHLWKISFERLLLFMPNVRNGSVSAGLRPAMNDGHQPSLDFQK